ncbi:DNA mismatch repair ATPase MutS [Deferribacter desulfuricans SSM1]|uniref:DNA mismatch repair protein MutS n=1 Tax=Deferribacter desulfuricans (strain DSM 14783 / JCM 11476 / NBRC 101012 / SSM1) TaxID=639282 RepID=D3PA79_DEFDS|nr:DNA mismatch repair protein MutS [Deferribacter desulfuricans]BAI81619.1 DNA mismatch repair ATPase MutS [Deferribacter desulfuricans SSM1]
MVSKEAKLTPMMKQYYEVKEKYPDCIIFFRMGDFYEMFDDDAIDASKILGIALTSRNKNDDNPIPMCGVPYHSYQTYLDKLISAGKKVAICEQLEDPATAKGIVKRGVIRVVTPATVIEEESIKSADFNFLLSFYYTNNTYFIALIDTSTGDLFISETKNIFSVIDKWDPKEIIGNKDLNIKNVNFQLLNYSTFEKTVKMTIFDHFNIQSFTSIGIDNTNNAIPIYFALKYLDSLLLDVTLKKPVYLNLNDELYLDSIAVNTLELVKNQRDGSVKNTLFQVLNFCKTALGERLLKFTLLRPLRDLNKIKYRQNVVEAFIFDQELKNNIQNLLKNVYDIERIASRLSAKRANARDLVWLKNSIKVLPEIKAYLINSNDPILKEFGEQFDNLEDIYELIDKSIVDDPPLQITAGGIIKTGFNNHIDELKKVKDDSTTLLARIEQKEREKTGITNLKVKYNKVFGYYIEVSKSHLSKVPDYFIRKQTLVNAERFITDELKELEVKILEAESKLTELEYQQFIEIREKVEKEIERIRSQANKIALLDMLLSFSEAAIRYEYTKPHINDSNEIKIIEGRHPVIEQTMNEPFVPNDIFINTEKDRLLIITGPNMAGKSTYLRMTALITILAHTGSFVPAKEANIGLVDRIFTRIGASDNLAKGESTFMVEMVETANILNNATEKSLIILDEIGRGTSTYDGLSIAWAVAEYISKYIKAKTLFATHYHELTDIALTTYGVKNYTIEVREWNDEVIFLRKIIPGSADRSYGIHVAKLAGLPEEVINRANEILATLEKNEFSIDGSPKLAKKSEVVIREPVLIFEDHPVIEELRNIDINNMTPLEALNTLAKLKGMLEDA